MSFFTKVKSIFFLFIFALCFCGVLFIKNVFAPKKENIKTIDTKSVQNVNITGTLRDLEKCNTELFNLKATAERLKNLPDIRKDIISLLLILHHIEEKLGKERDFSDDCVRLFAVASRVNVIQEYTMKYKENMFKTMCQFATQEDILNMVVPFEIKLLEYNYNNDKKSNNNKMNSIFQTIKFNFKKLFKKSKIEKSPLEQLILNNQYNDALTFIENKIKSEEQQTEEYTKLHISLNGLYLFDKMINDIYKILEENNK